MDWRTPVFIYASDPMSNAGAKAQLLGQPAIEVVGPADIGRARVALVVTDAVDDTAAKVVKAIQRDGIPRVVLVAARFGEDGVLAAVAAGVTGFLRRSEASSAKLVEAIREADRSGCQLPENLLRKAASVHADVFSAPPSPPFRPPGSQIGEAGGSTLTSRRLSVREEEVLRMVAEGFDTGDIADHLAFSESTIKSVLAKIMTRIEARNRCHAVAIMVREGLI